MYTPLSERKFSPALADFTKPVCVTHMQQLLNQKADSRAAAPTRPAQQAVSSGAIASATPAAAAAARRNKMGPARGCSAASRLQLGHPLRAVQQQVRHVPVTAACGTDRAKEGIAVGKAGCSGGNDRMPPTLAQVVCELTSQLSN